jgi:hypothetical protein
MGENLSTLRKRRKIHFKRFSNAANLQAHNVHCELLDFFFEDI